MAIASLTRGSVFQEFLNELFIADPRRSRGFRQTRIIRRIGKNSRQRIRFQHVRLSVGIEADIDSCPVSATKHAERVERYALNRRLKLSRDTRWTLENVERILGTIPDELRVEAVNRKRALGQRLEIHRDQGQHRRFGAIAEDRAGELLARQKFLDENRLPIVLQEELGLPEKLVAVPAKVAVGDSLRGTFVDRLHKKRQLQLLGHPIEVGELLDEKELRRRDPVKGEGLLRSRFVEAERKREGVASGVRNSVKLADRGHVGFAVHPVESFGDVENNVWSRLPELLRKIFVRLEANDFSEA